MTPSKKIVLAMDDSPIVLEAIQMMLEDAGYVVVTANSIAELDQRCATTTPDLVVLDVQMPEAYGDDIGQIMRKVRKLDARILLFSSVDTPSLEARVKEAGLDGYVSKDAGLDALRERIDALLESKRPVP